MKLEYSSEVAEQILDKFHQKGWNLYQTNNNPHPDYAIKNNLASSLELNGMYVLFPTAKNPNDPKQVFDALETLAIKLNRKMPTIKIYDEKIPISGFTLGPTYIQIHSPEGIYTTYTEFLEGLESIIKTN